MPVASVVLYRRRPWPGLIFPTMLRGLISADLLGEPPWNAVPRIQLRSFCSPSASGGRKHRTFKDDREGGALTPTQIRFVPLLRFRF